MKRRGLCWCGCGAPTLLAPKTDRRAGNVAGEPKRFIQGHQHRRTAAPLEGYTVDPTTGCWTWQLATDHKGYGRLKRGGRMQFAHTYYWEQVHGPVPVGLELDHLCVNPPCCNPAHLEAVTPTENKRRSRATKLTAAQVAFIKASDLRNVALAAQLGVDPSNVSHIRRGFSWGDVDAA